MIETERLVLRPWRHADKPTFARIANTPGMMAALGGVCSRADMDALVDKRIADQERHGHCYWAMELRQTGELVGSCGVRVARNYPDLSVQGMHEIGWRVAEAHWGRGLAREAAMASLAWTWAHTSAPHVAAWTTAGNRRSWRLMERLGMVRRPDDDFNHPDRAPGDPLRAHIVYRIVRPA